jgi:hypothetical protein
LPPNDRSWLVVPNLAIPGIQNLEHRGLQKTPHNPHNSNFNDRFAWNGHANPWNDSRLPEQRRKLDKTFARFLFGWESSTDISHKRTNSQESIERKRCRFD